MILENKSAAFEINFDGKGYSIPEGKFEVEDNLGKHIIISTAKWEGTVVEEIKADKVIGGVNKIEDEPVVKEEPTVTPETETEESEVVADEEAE